MPGCFIMGCKARWSKKHANVAMHVFPRNLERINNWLLRLKVPEEGRQELCQTIFNSRKGSYRLCAKHFTSDCYEERGFSMYLKKDAVPTLFLEDTSTLEHSYSKQRDHYRQQPTTSGHYNSCTEEDPSFMDVDLRPPSPSEQHPSASPAQVTCKVFAEPSVLEFPQFDVVEEVETSFSAMDTSLAVMLPRVSGKKKKKKRNRDTKTIGTRTDPFVGREHKGSQYDKSIGSKHKQTQARRRAPFRSVAIQCNVANLPLLATLPKETDDCTGCQTSVVMETVQAASQESIEVTLHETNGGDIVGEVVSDESYSFAPKRCKSNDHNVPEEGMEHGEFSIDPNGLDTSPVYIPGILENTDHVCERKFLVFESCLDKLLFSSKCKGRKECSGNIARIKKYKIGSAVLVTGFCSFGHRFHLWCSQPLIGKMPVGNVLLSAGILCSGSSFVKVNSLFSTIGMLQISKSTHDKIQKDYLFPTINHHWQSDRLETITRLQGEPVAIACDAQMDSRGQQARYCVYSFLENTTKKIIDFQVERVQPGVVHVAVAKQAFQTALDRLRSDELKIRVVCTDGRFPVEKLLRDQYKEIAHQVDVWHVAKSVGCKLMSASRKAKCAPLVGWVAPAQSHLRWSASTSKQDPFLMREKWSSLVYHAANQHQWPSASLYKSCQHGRVRERQQRLTAWLVPGSAAHVKLKEIVLNAKLLRDMESLSHFCHTSEFKAFHRTALKYRSKRTRYLLSSIVARTQLAALHHNDNVLPHQVVVKRITRHGQETPHHPFMCSKEKRGRVDGKTVEPTGQAFLRPLLLDVLEMVAGAKTFP